MRVPAGLRARAKLSSREENHLFTHTKKERDTVPRLNQAQGRLDASSSLPDVLREWTCWQCGKALPVLPSRCAKELSIRSILLTITPVFPPLIPTEVSKGRTRSSG